VNFIASIVSVRGAGQFVDRLERSILVWTVLGLALIGFIEVFLRYLFNYSFTWYEELGRYLGVFVTFLGASLGVKTGSHFAMDLLVSRLKRPWQELLRAATATLSGFFFFMVTYYSWKIVFRMYGFETTSPALGIPMYLAYLPIPVFSMVIGGRFVGRACTVLRSLHKGNGTGCKEPR
jgi:C4-dicarboxylate transporter, DctQ subunit